MTVNTCTDIQVILGTVKGCVANKAFNISLPSHCQGLIKEPFQGFRGSDDPLQQCILLLGSDLSHRANRVEGASGKECMNFGFASKF